MSSRLKAVKSAAVSELRQIRESLHTPRSMLGKLSAGASAQRAEQHAEGALAGLKRRDNSKLSRRVRIREALRPGLVVQEIDSGTAKAPPTSVERPPELKRRDDQKLTARQKVQQALFPPPVPPEIAAPPAQAPLTSLGAKYLPVDQVINADSRTLRKWMRQEQQGLRRKAGGTPVPPLPDLQDIHPAFRQAAGVQRGLPPEASTAASPLLSDSNSPVIPPAFRRAEPAAKPSKASRAEAALGEVHPDLRDLAPFAARHIHFDPPGGESEHVAPGHDERPNPSKLQRANQGKQAAVPAAPGGAGGAFLSPLLNRPLPPLPAAARAAGPLDRPLPPLPTAAQAAGPRQQSPSAVSEPDFELTPEEEQFYLELDGAQPSSSASPGKPDSAEGSPLAATNQSVDRDKAATTQKGLLAPASTTAMAAVTPSQRAVAQAGRSSPAPGHMSMIAEEPSPLFTPTLDTQLSEGFDHADLSRSGQALTQEQAEQSVLWADAHLKGAHDQGADAQGDALTFNDFLSTPPRPPTPTSTASAAEARTLTWPGKNEAEPAGSSSAGDISEIEIAFAPRQKAVLKALEAVKAATPEASPTRLRYRLFPTTQAGRSRPLGTDRAVAPSSSTPLQPRLAEPEAQASQWSDFSSSSNEPPTPWKSLFSRALAFGFLPSWPPTFLKRFLGRDKS